MHIVTTTDGNVFTGAFSNVGAKGKDAWPGDEATANSVCAKANAQAESRGYAVRYEVKEV